MVPAVPQIVLVRHGETVGQSSIRLYGATDVALAQVGEVQVRAAGRSLVEGSAAPRFDAVFTSPLVRARRSAEVLLEAIAHPPIAIEEVEGFREINFGRWEGWTWDEVKDRDPEGLARREREGLAFRFPEGEGRQDFVARVQAAVDPTLGARLGAGAERVLAVVHKGVIKAICAHLLRRPFIELDGLELPLGAVRSMQRDGATPAWTLAPMAGDRVVQGNIQGSASEGRRGLDGARSQEPHS